VFVSHDRYFIDQLATRVFEIGGGEVHVYPGNYEDFLWSKERGGAAGSIPAGDGRAASLVTGANGNGASAPRAPKKKINPYKLKEMQQHLKTLEREIATCEGDIAA